MKNRTLRKLLEFMKGHKLLYTVGVLGFALLLLIFQIQIALLFLELFNAIQVGSFDTVLASLIRFSISILILISLIPFFAYLAQKAAVKITGKLRLSVFEKLTLLPISFVRKTHSAELSSIATNDLNEVEKAYTNYFFNFAIQVITGIGAAIVMMLIEWRLALIVFMAGFITYVTNMIYAKRLRKVSRDVQDRLGNLNTKLSNILAGIHVIRIFNIQHHVSKLFTKSNQDLLDTSLIRVERQAKIDALNTLVFSISFAGVTLVGGFLVLEGFILLGVIVAIVQLSNNVLSLVSGLGSFISNMQTSLAAGDRILEFLETNNEPKSYETKLHKASKDSVISLDNIVFGYDDQIIVKNLSFSIKDRETVAFVGPSGGGKTTIFKLLLHFYISHDGSISLFQNPTSNLPLETIRSSFAYVPQEPFLFNKTIKENIRYGNLNASDDDILNASKEANAHEFISTLENGYDTLVGEHGTKISGGQRQRIAIARAILKDAPILLLDEATSALDTESEVLIQEALERLKATKTTLIIAHRLSTIKDADRIFVIEKGQIIEEGSHEKLLSDNTTLYSKLYQTKPIIDN